ncbi:MAG: ankyrin repeat domain-containing protein [Rickettsiales bacterium]
MLKKLINDFKDGLDELEALYNAYTEIEKQEILRELINNSNFKELINDVNEKYEIQDLTDFFQELEKYFNNIDREMCLVENVIDPLNDQYIANDSKRQDEEEDDDSANDNEELEEEDDNSEDDDESEEEDVSGVSNKNDKLPKKLITNIEHIFAIVKLKLFFKNKLITKINEYTEYANKQSGHTTGAIVIKTDDGAISLIKSTTRNEIPGGRTSERREWIQEYITSPLYKRLLPGDVTPDIELVISSDKNRVLFRSIFLKNFYTIKEAQNKGIINQDNAKTIINFEKLFVTALFLGEVDYHKGNLGIIINDNKIYAAKVDHGRSAYNFYEDVHDLIHKLHSGFSKWIGYDKSGFQLNIQKLKQAVNEIIKISPVEIETLLNSRFEKLRKHNVEYKDSYRDLTYSSREHYPAPEKLSFTGKTSVSHPSAIWYKARYFIEELRKIDLIPALKDKKEHLRSKVNELLSELKSLKEAEDLNKESKEKFINIDPRMKDLSITQLEEMISELQIHYKEGLESLTHRVDTINDRQKLLKSSIKAINREGGLYSKLYKSFLNTNNNWINPIKEYLSPKEETYLRMLQYREAEKWYLNKYIKQLEVFKQFYEYLDFISKIDELDEGFKNGEWLFRIPHGESPQEWVKKNNYLINEKVFMSPMIFLLWKAPAIKGKGLGALIKNPKYNNFIDQIIFQLALHDLEHKTKAVENIIAAGVDINHSDSNADNALMMAARDGEVEVIAYLMGLGADIEKANSKFETPLLIAIKKDKATVIKFLLARNANLEAADINGNNALLLAIISGNLDIIETIINLNPAKDVMNKNFETPASLAAKFGYLDVLKVLTKDYLPYLDIAVKNHHVNMVQYILDFHSGSLLIQYIKDKALLFCIKNKADIRMIEMLLANGANPYAEIEGQVSLKLAVELGYAEITAAIINNINEEINLETKNIYENSAFMLSVENANHKVIKAFYDYGFKHDIDKIKQALEISLSSNDFGVVKLLLSNYADFFISGGLNYIVIKPTLGSKEFIEKLFSIVSLPSDGLVEYSGTLGNQNIYMKIRCKNLPMQQLIEPNLEDNIKTEEILLSNTKPEIDTDSQIEVSVSTSLPKVIEPNLGENIKTEEILLPSTESAIDTDSQIELSVSISIPKTIMAVNNLMIGSDFTQKQVAAPLLITFPVEEPKGNGERTSEGSGSEAKIQKFQFIKGTLCGKLLLSPALNYLKDNIKDEQNDKNLFDYFSKSVSESASYVVKSLIFAGVSFADILPDKPYGLANKMILYKVSSDLIYNIVIFQVDKTSEMFSKEYLKEMTFFVIPPTLSMLGFNIDEMLGQNSFLTGLIVGSGVEIVDLAGVGMTELYNIFYSE